MANFQTELNQINSDCEKALQLASTTNYWNLSTSMNDLEGVLREHIQHTTQDQIQQVIRKLKTQQPLTSDELEYVKLWIVGDAQHYIKLENNYKDWVKELKRIVDEVNSVNVEHPSFEESSKLRALLLDGIRVAGDIVFYLKQKERIKNFTESTQEIDPTEADLLIRLLEGKIRSPRE